MIDQEIKALCKEVLEEGLEIFDLSLGIVSRVDDSSYKVIAVMPEGGAFKAGESFALKDTYCREVVAKQSTVALTHLRGAPGLCKHPLYTGLPLESYISAPIMVSGKVWGTLNFSSMKIRNEEFCDEEIQLIESRAEFISRKITSNM